MRLTSAGRFRMDELWFRHGRTFDLLAAGGPFRLRYLSQFYRFTGSRRTVNRLDNAHIHQALGAGRLRLAVAENAVGEIKQLRRKLIVHGKFARLSLIVADRNFHFDRLRVLERVLERHGSFGAGEDIRSDIGSAETANECRQTLTGETQRRANHFFDFPETFVTASRG